MEKSIIVFDGECNLCNGVVGWLLELAKPDLFEFVAFQSQRGQYLLALHDMPTKTLETVVLFDQNGVHIHSDGFLNVIYKIPRLRLVAMLFALVPRSLRDAIYKIASANRVKWFGKSAACAVAF